MQNACVESFNGKFRGECLNEHWFLDLNDACRTIEAYGHDYNRYRPHISHSSLGGLTPEEFARRPAARRAPEALGDRRPEGSTSPRYSHSRWRSQGGQATPDGHVRCIRLSDEDPEPRSPLELVQAFPDEEEAAAWELLHELGDQPPVT